MAKSKKVDQSQVDQEEMSKKVDQIPSKKVDQRLLPPFMAARLSKQEEIKKGKKSN